MKKLQIGIVLLIYGHIYLTHMGIEVLKSGEIIYGLFIVVLNAIFIGVNLHTLSRGNKS